MPFFDDENNEIIQNIDNALISDSETISERMEENEENRIDTLDDVNSMIEALKGNLAKIEKIHSTSDLVMDSSNSEDTKNRIEELKRIREVLGGEDDTENKISIEQSVDIPMSNGFNEFKERLKEQDKENVKHDYALGVLASNVNFSIEYKGILKERYANADKISQVVFDIAVHQKMLSIADGNWQEGAHYYPLKRGDRKRGVYYNAHADELDDKKGKGTTFFHEIGHMIDHAFGGKHFLSSTDEFLLALNNDLLKIKEKLNNDTVWKQKFLELILADNSAHSISDILEGLTNGAISGKFGHMGGDLDYWKRDKYKVCNESFAHFFEASMGSGIKLKRLRICFPSAYKEFENILKNIVQNNVAGTQRFRERSL